MFKFLFLSVVFANPSYDSLIEKYSNLYRVDKSLIYSLIKTESNFNAKSFNKDCYGLMQIQLGTARVMGFEGDVNKLYDPEINIKLGTKYLRYLLILFDEDKYKTLAAYNRGWGKVLYVKKDWSQDAYVKKVLNTGDKK